MENTWKGFLDIIGLCPKLREEAGLEICLEFPNAYPHKKLILELFNCIKELYFSDKCLMLWFEQSSNNPSIYLPITKIVSIDNYKFIQLLWMNYAGNYILFLPNRYDINNIGTGNEEEIIGKILTSEKQLLLKTPDGNEVLHLKINKAINL